MLREPRFWHARDAGPIAVLLWPLGAAYGAAVRLRHAVTRPERTPVPVICIGNPGLGGGGKTPTVIEIVRRLEALGETPHVLSRGYGGRLAGPVRVDPDHHSADEVGDEPLLIARHVPVHVARERRAGARHAARAGASVIVMDDGYQNPTLVKDLSLLVVDGAAGIGNGLVFPAGPLREAIAPQLARAGAAVVVGSGSPGDAFAERATAAGRPVLRARLVAGAGAPDLAGRAVVAFCGIARPEKFSASLRAEGAQIAASIVFRDHHPFTQADVARIIAAADADPDALVITTEKDAVRLADDNDPGAGLRSRLATLPVEMRFDEPDRLDALLRSVLAR